MQGQGMTHDRRQMPHRHSCPWFATVSLMQGSGTQVTREMETQVLITALALPYGGKILFAATEFGIVRCYKYPLTGTSDAHTPQSLQRLLRPVWPFSSHGITMRLNCWAHMCCMHMQWKCLQHPP